MMILPPCLVESNILALRLSECVRRSGTPWDDCDVFGRSCGDATDGSVRLLSVFAALFHTLLTPSAALLSLMAEQDEYSNQTRCHLHRRIGTRFQKGQGHVSGSCGRCRGCHGIQAFLGFPG